MGSLRSVKVEIFSPRISANTMNQSFFPFPLSENHLPAQLRVSINLIFYKGFFLLRCVFPVLCGAGAGYTMARAGCGDIPGPFSCGKREAFLCWLCSSTENENQAGATQPLALTTSHISHVAHLGDIIKGL